MISINDLSCNALPANSAELHALERKMIDELYAKVNYVPPKATPLDATKSHAQWTAERYGFIDHLGTFKNYESPLDKILREQREFEQLN